MNPSVLPCPPPLLRLSLFCTPRSPEPCFPRGGDNTRAKKLHSQGRTMARLIPFQSGLNSFIRRSKKSRRSIEVSAPMSSYANGILIKRGEKRWTIAPPYIGGVGVGMRSSLKALCDLNPYTIIHMQNVEFNRGSSFGRSWALRQARGSMGVRQRLTTRAH